MRIGVKVFGAIALLAFFVIGAQAGTIHGTVKNGTTGKPAAGIEVILIQLQGGMQPVANSKTDGQGQFSFDNASLGAQPMLVRAVYHGVNFHQPAPPGKTEIQIEVFEPTADAKTITVPSHIVIVQPNGSSLLIGEEYSIQNSGLHRRLISARMEISSSRFRKTRSCSRPPRGGPLECRWCRRP